MLHKVIDQTAAIRTLYCGPHTMCAITGLPSDKLFERLGGYFTSVCKASMMKYMYSLDFEIPYHSFRPYIFGFCLQDFHVLHKNEGPFAVFTVNHVFAYSKGIVSDTLTGIHPIHFNKWIRRAKHYKIEGWYRFIPKRSIANIVTSGPSCIPSWERELVTKDEGLPRFEET